MKQIFMLFVIAVLCAGVLLPGCSSATRSPSPPNGSGGPGPAAPEPADVPDEDDLFDYTASNENCNCTEYRTKDALGAEYLFRANYRVDEAIITTIRIEFINNGKDTMRLDPGMVKIASRNVGYQHNDKFLPLPDMVLPPGKSDQLELSGRDLQGGESAWNKIAGEKLTVTLKGMRMGKRTLAQQQVTFIPENPMIKK